MPSHVSIALESLDQARSVERGRTKPYAIVAAFSAVAHALLAVEDRLREMTDVLKRAS